jgi:hypothetical protein
VSTPLIVDKQDLQRHDRRSRQPGGPNLGKEHTSDARRLAAAILEVLAGTRTPAEAATALGLSLPRYYQLEAQGLRGLLLACEPRPIGRQATAETALKALRQENQRLQREAARHQALARAAQRSLGLPPPPAAHAAKAKAGKKTRKRRLARALSVARRLQQDNDAADGPPLSAPGEAK